VSRRRRSRISPFGAGLIVVVIVLIVTYLVFTNDIPFTRPFQIKAVVANAVNLKARSPVRIAGVSVGQVEDVKRAGGDSTASVVTMDINSNGQPIYKDAELKVRPRIFLEGNFFVDLQPGTPGAPKLHDGDTIPITQTAGPVQLDQVLTALQSNTRDNLQTLIRGYGAALDGKPLPGEDRTQVRAVRGLTAAQALNRSLNYSPQALRGIAIVNQASLGEDMHDLSRLIAGQQKVAAALSVNDQSLEDLVTNFNRTTAAFAAEQTNLRSSIHQLPGVLDAANTTFDSLNRSFPPTRAFAREILPGVRETDPTIQAAFPWIAQTRALVSQPELKGLVHDLRPATSDLSSVTDQSLILLPQVDLVNRCAIDVILPTGDKPIDDGFLSTGLPNYKEFWQTMTSLSSESQNFDANGQYTRFQPGGGDQTVSTGPSGVSSFSGSPLFGNSAAKPLGTRPARPAAKPPVNRKLACYRNTPPNLAATTGGAP
jgi:phospholipid/cholesterol/gamma-HCH transport system substrate-binding protein